MATKKGDKDAITEEAVTLATARAEKKFPLGVLRDNSVKLFGVTSSTFVGATSQQKDGDYTIPEIKKVIESWLNKEVE